MTKGRVNKDERERKRDKEQERERERITMGHVALLGLFGTSLGPVASGY